MCDLHPRLDILPEAQRDLWPTLVPLRTLGFVLHGGTAIALRLGHRVSVDFDFFSNLPLDRAAIASTGAPLATGTTIQDEPNALSLMIGSPTGSVKVSLFGNVSLGRVGVPELTSDRVALVASLDDLMAQKLKVVMQRAEAKDYRDIAAMARSGVNLETGIAGAMALFGEAFAPAECAKALVYFKGGDLSTLGDQDRSTLLEIIRTLPARIDPAVKRSEHLV